MGLRINDVVPNFTAETDQGTITFHDWIGDSWAILFSHPKDFTPVCTTEFSAVAQLSTEWAERNTKVIGVSVDSAEDHRKWKSDIESYGKSEAGFPIIADEGLAVSKAFDMLPVFIIGPDKQLKLSMTYPMTVGRNFAEILRALDGLQISAKGVATPANWVPGEDVIIPPSVSNEDAKEKFGEFETIFPYLRKTKAPE